MENSESYRKLLDEQSAMRSELEEMKFRLEEANDTIEAIRSGEIDALVVKTDSGHHQLYTLKSADHTYRIFIEQMTEGAITLNPDGIILYCNSQFAALTGLSLEKVIGQLFNKFIVPEQQQECNILISKAWKNNIKRELSLLNNNKQKIPVLLSLKTLNLDEGLSMSIILTDLSEQKETQKLLQEKNAQLEEAQKIAQDLNANLENTVKYRTKELEINILEKIRVEEELRSNEERLSRILETMAEGVGIYNTKGHLTYANPMARKILGIKQDKLSETYDDPDWENLRIDGTPLPEKEHPIYIAIHTGQPVYDYEIAVQPSAKDRIYVSINAAPIRDEKGKIIAGVGTFMDVTNRRLLLQQRDDFISIASHELRTPITSLKASLQLLTRIKENPSSGMLANLIEQANRSMNKVSSLIGDLLNASKMNQGQLHLNKTRFILSRIIDDCCSHIRTEGNYTIHTGGNLDLEVYADAERIEQVVVNFVNNAVKYAPESKDIYIHIEASGNMTKVSVTDKGPGVSPEKLPHLFDRYYRVDSSGSQYSGLGLGLYISAEIIKRHGGHIGAESSLGHGSTFWFTLPLINTDLAD